MRTQPPSFGRAMASTGPFLAAFGIAVAMLAPLASAHVTVTATAPEGPVQVGSPITIEAEASALCAAIVAEYQAMGEDELTFGLAPGHASYLSATAQPMDWTVNQCEPEVGEPENVGNGHAHGELILTVGPQAPAFTPFEVSIVAYGNDPSTPEGGTPANITVTVAYFAQANVTLGEPRLAGNSTVVPVHVQFATNFATTLTATATVDGTRLAQVSKDVDPPALANRTQGTAELELTLPANGKEARIAVVAAAKSPPGAAPSLPAVTKSIHLLQAPAPVPPTSSSTSKDSPTATLLLVAPLAAAFLARRRA